MAQCRFNQCQEIDVLLEFSLGSSPDMCFSSSSFHSFFIPVYMIEAPVYMTEAGGDDRS